VVTIVFFWAHLATVFVGANTTTRSFELASLTREDDPYRHTNKRDREEAESKK